MEYTKFGNTGLEVSKLCLGCMSFGDASLGFHSGWLLDEEKSRMLFHPEDLRCSKSCKRNICRIF